MPYSKLKTGGTYFDKSPTVKIGDKDRESDSQFL